MNVNKNGGICQAPIPIIIAAKLLSSANELAGLGGLSEEVLRPLLDHEGFVGLGAISPDYPYLGIGAVIKLGSSKGWAEAMHRTHTGDRLKAGIGHVKDMPSSKASPPAAIRRTKTNWIQPSTRFGMLC